MAKKLRLGILGMSDGNGHPYSWSAIFNGYDEGAMSKCPFPVIPDYLSEQNFPQDGLGELAEVTHIWTQNHKISQEIAKASKIKHIVLNAEDMIGHIDAVLLARDDSESHYEMAKPFIEADLPIFIDKPICTSTEEARRIFALEKSPNQIFTTSALRFSKSIELTAEDIAYTGSIKHIEATIPKLWSTYAVHLLEPIVAHQKNRGALSDVHSLKRIGSEIAFIKWSNLSAYIHVTGKVSSQLKFTFYGEENSVEKIFTDTYYSFKASLEYFVMVILGEKTNISRAETLEIVQIIDKYYE